MATEGINTSIVPVTILTGFLGSGKTTLLNYILTQNHGKRIAVIENEFGEEIGVESLIARNGADGETFADFYELSNGCICCSVRDDLVSTLEELLTRRDRFDYVLVETTGMADPGKLASMFWVDSELEGRIALDGIITLVDAKHVMDHLDKRTPEVLSQVAYADRIIVNKSDLMPLESDRQDLQAQLNEMNALAPCIWTERSTIDLGSILNINAFSADRAMEIHNQQPVGQLSHTGNVKSICVSTSIPLSLRGIEYWLGRLLWEENDMTIYRIKGVISIDQNNHKHILQGVQELFDITPSEEWSNEDEKLTKIIFIGIHLNEKELQDGLDQCYKN